MDTTVKMFETTAGLVGTVKIAQSNSKTAITEPECVNITVYAVMIVKVVIIMVKKLKFE